MTEARRYDRAQVTALAQESFCMTDLLTRLGVEITPRVRRNMRARLGRWAVDTAHWDQSPRRVYSDADLAAAVAVSTSVAGVLRRLGVPLSGGQHAHLARRIRRAGIDTSHFLGQAHYRGRQAPRKKAEDVLVVLPPGSARLHTPQLRRALVDCGVEERCLLCGLDGTWQGQPLRLVIDHINGEWLDNRLENLRFLCPNCHAQTSTWCRIKAARSA
jgi:hypothetical protein